MSRMNFKHKEWKQPKLAQNTISHETETLLESPTSIYDLGFNLMI